MLNFNTKIRQICEVCKFGVGGEGIDLTNKHAHRVIALTGVHCWVYFIFRECLFICTKVYANLHFFKKIQPNYTLIICFWGVKNIRCYLKAFFGYAKTCNFSYFVSIGINNSVGSLSTGTSPFVSPIR